MATATQLFNGSDGGAVGSLTGYSSWLWTNTPSSTALIRTAQSIEGGSSVRLTGNTVTAARYGCAPAAGTHYQSCYLYLTAAPSVAFSLTALYAGTYYWKHNVGITTDRRIYSITAASNYNTATDTSLTNGTVVQSAANVVPLNEWCRIETAISTTSANISVFTGANLHTSTAAASANGTSGSIGTYDQLVAGPESYDASALRAFVSSSQYIYMDRLIVSDSAMPAAYSPTTWTSTAPLDVTVSLTADGTVTSATKESTAPLDVTVGLTAEATVTNESTAPLDVSFSLTAEASSTSDSDPRWGTPETWGDLWGWWTTSAPGDNDGVVPVGFALNAEGAAVAPTLSTAGLDVAVTLTGESTASRSETSSLSVDFSLTAEASVIPGAANAALLTLDIALAAEAMVDTSVPSTMPLVFALAAAGTVRPFTECPDGIVCRPSTGVIDRPGPLD